MQLGIDAQPRVPIRWEMPDENDAHFPTTHWTLVSRLRSGDSGVAQRALNDLVTQYRYTLYAYIRRRGLAHHDAEDALHDFLFKLLQAHVLEDMREARGKLRGFLGTSLGHFLMSWRRGEARREFFAGESTADATSADEMRYTKEQFSEDDTPERVFDRKWGHALMTRVLERLKAQCEAKGKGVIFTALCSVLLRGGSLRGHDAASIAAKLGISEGTLRVTLNRHLRDYRAVLEDEVLQTVERPEDVEGEIAHLMSVFGGE
jgi:RNA polymerase sigma-70 factor (ECF subfamily)